jgi:predicted MFS family arabinose efflux permease
MFMLQVQTVPYLISVGIPPLQAASVYGIIGALSVVGMITSGWMAGRVGFRAVGIASFAMTLTGVALLDTMGHLQQAMVLGAFVLTFGISQGTRGPLIATLSARLFDGPAAGSIFGTITAFGSLGGAFGSWLAGLLYDASGTYEVSFAVAAVSLLFAATPFVAVPEFRTR